MADDLQNRGPQDRSRVNLSEVHEIQYWTKKFNVSEQALRDAVARAGSSAEAVQKALKH